MKLSVVTVCYNSANTIEHTIKSVTSQAGVEIEYIVIDGGSTDGTLDVIGCYMTDIDVLVSESDKGIYDAMNKGLALSSGHIVSFLNADDVFAHKYVAENAIKELREHCIEVVFGDVNFCEDGKIVRHYSSKNFKPWKLRFGWMPPHPGSFATKALYEKYGPFNKNFHIAADYEMFVRWLLVNHVKYHRINEVLVNMAPGGISTESWSARLLLNREIVSACRMNGIYTNLLFVLSKFPAKILEVMKPKLLGKRLGKF